jgi:formate hydrogenlyase transcriptional activator
MDEIGELPLNAQAKLLQVLQEGIFERVGGVQPIKTDVRIIAATNKNLKKLVEERQFRDDLFFRLNIFPVHVPPLRERAEDIPVLGRYFGDTYCRKLDRTRPHMQPDATDMLMGYSWPGNVRELQNFIERIIILKSGQAVTGQDIKNILSGSPGQESEARTLAEAEKKHIEKVLQKTRGRIAGPSGAAHQLGMKRSTLQYKMKKLEIKPSDYRQ